MASFKVTKKQAEAAQILADIIYKGLALITALGLLVAGFGFMTYSILHIQTVSAATASTLTEGVFGYIFKQVYTNLFSVPASATTSSEIAKTG